MKVLRHLFVAGFFLALLISGSLAAQELIPDTEVLMKAKVLAIVSQEVRDIPGTDTAATYQTIRVFILDGPEKGKDITIENDFLSLKEGEVFYLRHITNQLGGSDQYSVVEPYRLPWVVGVVLLFIATVLLIGGTQGARALASLVLSLTVIFYVLLPGITSGYSPVLMSMGIAALIVVIGSYITHGFNRTTTSAVIGMILAIGVTGLLAFITVSGARLSGFGSEEAVYLNINTRGSIDFAGLLLGGILIGLLGILYDAAIGQAVAVEEMVRIGPHLSRRYLFTRALRIGREHIGALVNTLAIAYVGASLPLLLLVYSGASAGLDFMINSEVFATEIVRSAIGSIGLILAVPLSTLAAVFMLHRREMPSSSAVIGDERHLVEESISSHSHM